MNLPYLNNRTSKTKALIFSVLVVFGIAILLFILLRARKNNEYESLASKIPAGQAIQAPEQPIENHGPYSSRNEIKINVVSTGEVDNYRMEDADTGTHIADASIVNFVTKDTNGNTKKIRIILQIFLASDRKTNYFQVPLEVLSLIYSTTIPSKISNGELARLFPKGSEWKFIFDIDRLQEPDLLLEPIKKYYGEDTALIKEFLESGLTTDYEKPLMMDGMSSNSLINIPKTE
jgi:HAMP domain-containing protein